jgi:hypothetical protein
MSPSDGGCQSPTRLPGIALGRPFVKCPHQRQYPFAVCPTRPVTHVACSMLNGKPPKKTDLYFKAASRFNNPLISCELSKGSHVYVQLDISYDWSRVQAVLGRYVENPIVLTLKRIEIGNKEFVRWAPRRKSYGCAEEWTLFPAEIRTLTKRWDGVWSTSRLCHIR